MVKPELKHQRATRRSRGGFALPFTIFLVTLLTIMLGASFTRVASEHLIAQSSGAHISALSLAQSGLNAFFHDTMSVRPASGDSIRYNMAGGYAWVHAEEFQKPADTIANDIIYVVRSVGNLIDASQGPTVQGTRTVARMARWQTGRMTVLGAFTSADEVDFHTGGLTAIYASASCPAAQSVPTVRVAAGGLKNYSNLDSATGLAPVVGDLDSIVAVQTMVDWPLIESGGFQPDYSSVQWGDSTYSTQWDSNSLNVFGSRVGTGVLMVDNDLTVFGTLRWYGIVLVGRRARFRGDTEIHGAIVTGLDAAVGGNGGESEVGDWGSDFRLFYDPCQIDKALEPFKGFKEINRTFVDSWSTY